MSRCFPYPPPGYVRNPQIEQHLNSLQKEKHREKKYKKEKKDNEKREHKEKKDKNEKHREKKDRKEKHRDKKDRREKHGDKKDRKEKHKEKKEKPNKTGADREIKDSKFGDELANGIRDNLVDNTTQKSMQRSDGLFMENLDKFFANSGIKMQDKNEKGTGKQMFGSLERGKVSTQKSVLRPDGQIRGRNGKTFANEGVKMQKMVNRELDSTKQGMVPLQRRNEGPYSKIVANSGVKMQKPNKEILPDSVSSMQRTHVNGIKNFKISVQMKKEASERGPDSKIVPKTRANMQKVESFASFVERKAEATGPATPNTEEKERDKGNNRVVFANHVMSITNLREKDMKSDRKRSCGYGSEKKKRKERERINESESKLDIFSSVKPLVNVFTDKGKINGICENGNDKKGFELNGFTQDHESRPTKVSRLTPPNNVQLENNSKKLSPPFQIKGEIIVEGENIKGSQENKRLNTLKPSKKRTKPEHPDTSYLSEIYNVPTMQEWYEFDEQEWLFERRILQENPNPNPDCEDLKGDEQERRGLPHLWAQAVRIEMEDLIALPYVIPF